MLCHARATYMTRIPRITGLTTSLKVLKAAKQLDDSGDAGDAGDGGECGSRIPVQSELAKIQSAGEQCAKHPSCVVPLYWLAFRTRLQ